MYKTVSDAQTRNEYLGTFDSGLLDGTRHTVYGTIIIRISEALTASRQEDYEGKILAALTKMEEQ